MLRPKIYMSKKTRKECRDVIEGIDKKIWDDSIKDTLEYVSNKFKQNPSPLETLLKGVKPKEK